MRTISERARQFHAAHPICDMLGFNLNHPRFLLDDVDLGLLREDTYRADFPKLARWGIRLTVAKGAVSFLNYDFKDLWSSRPERRPGRDSEPMFLSAALPSPTLLALATLDRLLLQVEDNPDKAFLVRSVSDLDRVGTDPRIAVLLAANRSDWFGDSPGALRQFARLGLRMITLGQGTRELGWDPSNETRSGGRLTELGVRMIEEMNSQGILIDLAHNNDPCALDAIEVSASPVVDTHSVPRALQDDDRAIPDEIMRALAARGGVLGIMPPITRPAGNAAYEYLQPAEVETTLTYVRYAVDMMGIDAVGIGTHFNTAIMPALTDALLDDGFGEDDVAALLGGNFLRVLRAVLPGSAKTDS
jgi:membrane dipeptidase